MLVEQLPDSACASWPGRSAPKTRVNALLSRPSTCFRRRGRKEVDARDKRGHDGAKHGSTAIGVIAAMLVIIAPAAAAGDLKAGRLKARACQTCHGLDGQAVLPEAPNLAGQNPVYLVNALKDYRGGARRNEMMSVVARGLSDEDIADLAAYFAAIPVTVSEPPR